MEYAIQNGWERNSLVERKNLGKKSENNLNEGTMKGREDARKNKNEQTAR